VASGISARSADIVGDHDGVGLAQLVTDGDVAPAELVVATIERANAVEPSLNAIVATDYEQALETARHKPAGTFGGVPTFIKDMNGIAGQQTLHGSAALANSAPAARNDVVVDMFETLGTIRLGKSTMPEFGLTCGTEFPDGTATRNPWNLRHGVGGSSGGAGALVAAGVIPFAHAADGGGSIRIPAAACGLVGLKASRGRIMGPPSDGKAPIDLVAHGIVSRTVRDTCAFVAGAEQMYHNPLLPPVGLVERPLDRPLRIGVLYQPPADVAVDGPTVSALDESVALLETLGHVVEPISIPVAARFVDDFVLYWGTAAMVLQFGGKRLLDPEFDASALTDFTKGLARHAKRRAPKILGAIRRLRKANDLFSEGLGICDVMMTPTVGQVTPEIGHFATSLSYDELMPRVAKWACFTGLANVAGTPGISLPLAHHEPLNLPIGIHFGARTGQERLLLRLALQLEEAQPFRRV
jgi:amidase